MSGRGVALVEDDPGVREALRDVIRLSVGRPCVAVGSFAEMVEVGAEVLACELVILDINLGPDQPSGVDAFRWLTEQGYGGRIAFLTAHASTHPLVQQAEEVGVARVLRKPVSIGVLERLVEGR